MQIEFQQKDSVNVVATVTVPSSDGRAESEKVARKLRGRAPVKGFRTGKAPIGLLLKMYDEDIRNDVISTFAQRAVTEHIVNNDSYEIIDEPVLEDARFPAGEDVVLKIRFASKASIPLDDFVGITSTTYDRAVSEADIDEAVQREVHRKTTFTPTDEASSSSHRVTTKWKAKNAEGAQPITRAISLDRPATFEPIVESLMGLGKGDVTEIELVDPIGELSVGAYEVEVTQVDLQERPAVTDEWVSSLGLGDDISTVAAFRDHLRANLESESASSIKRDTATVLQQTIVDAASFDVPDSFVGRALEQMYESMKGDLANRSENEQFLYKMISYEANLPEARDMVRWEMIQQEVSKEHSIEITEADEMAVFEQLYGFPITPDLFETVKGQINREALARKATERKVVDYFLDKASLTVLAADEFRDAYASYMENKRLERDERWEATSKRIIDRLNAQAAGTPSPAAADVDPVSA